LFTASTIAYGILNDKLSYDYGLGGSSVLAVDLETYEDLSEKDQELTWIMNSKLYVDCFGNIIMDNGVLQTVVLPACQNPYAWYDYASGVESAGKYVNMCNLYMLGEASEGHIELKDKNIWDLTADPEGVYNSSTPVPSTIPKEHIEYEFYAGKCSLFNLDKFRLYYGRTKTEVDTTFGPFNSEMSERQKAIFGKNGYFSVEAGGEAYEFMSWHCFADGAWSGKDYRSPRNFDFGGDESIKWYDPWFYKGTFNDLVIIDSINAFEKDSSTIKTTTVFGHDGEVLGGNTLPSPTFSNIKERNAFTKLSGSSSKAYLTSIFLSYVYAYYDDSTGEDRKVSWAYNKEAFPEIKGEIDWSDIEISTNKLYDETLSLTNMYLNPTENDGIFKVWFKNKLTAVLVGCHEDMVGKTSAVSTTGSTKYVGFSGYVTLPNLDDLEWTAFLLGMYDNLVVYFIIIMLLILLGYKMLGSITWQGFMLSGLLFAFCAYLPPRLINATVDGSNTICNAFYGDKFTYWALVQHEQYVSAINSAIEEDNEWSYLASVFKEQAKDSAENYALVTVRWQCPKKENYWADVKEELSDVSNGRIDKFVMPFARDTVDGETYTDVANNQYLYRSYTDLGTYANSLYKNGAMVSLNGVGDRFNSTTTGISFNGLRESLLSRGFTGTKFNTDAKNKWIQAYREPYLTDGSALGVTTYSEYGTRTATSILDSIYLGFTFDTARTDDRLVRNNIAYISDSDRFKTNRRMLDFSYNASVNTAWERGLADVNTAGVGRDYIAFNEVYGVPLSAFNTTLAKVNGRGDGSLGGTSVEEFKKDSDVASLVFANYTESPFMYFSYNLNDQLSSASLRGEASTYKDLFLLPDGSYFYNMLTTNSDGTVSSTNSGKPASDGFGELRDFMDIRTLFYVVIPYLRSINDVVLQYDETYGLFMYDGVELEYDSDNNIILPEELKDNLTSIPYGASSENGNGGEAYYKYIHNWEVAQLLNMYTPWVDIMYDCEYSEGETIYVLGEEFYVADPLDPLSYYEQDIDGEIIAGREMIFSRSEMAYFGLRMEDLTQVEQKIITLNDNCYAELLQILDYYNFQPEVLNTAIAMLETFEFNRLFSETSLIGKDHVLYPQNYELKNFSYDAYLRLILAGSTGHDLSKIDEADIYTTVVKNSSVLTGALFVVLDLFAVYAIPALKLFFVLAIFFIGILMILVASIKLEVKISSALMDSLVKPLVKFFGVTVGMAWLVSLFMYDGNTAVTGRATRVISLGDPTMVTLLMLILNIAVLVLYFEICRSVFKDCLKYAKAVGTSISGTIAGVGSMLNVGRHIGRQIQHSADRATMRKFLKDGAKGGSDGSASGGSASGGLGSVGSAIGSGVSKMTAKIPERKAETVGDNKYNRKIARAKEKYDSKLSKGTDKLVKREDVNNRRNDLRNALRTHSNDTSINPIQRKLYGKRADFLDKRQARGEAKLEKKYNRLETKDSSRSARLEKKMQKYNSKSVKRDNTLARRSEIKSASKAYKDAKKMKLGKK